MLPSTEKYRRVHVIGSEKSGGSGDEVTILASRVVREELTYLVMCQHLVNTPLIKVYVERLRSSYLHIRSLLERPSQSFVYRYPIQDSLFQSVAAPAEGRRIRMLTAVISRIAPVTAAGDQGRSGY